LAAEVEAAVEPDLGQQAVAEWEATLFLDQLHHLVEEVGERKATILVCLVAPAAALLMVEVQMQLALLVKVFEVVLEHPAQADGLVEAAVALVPSVVMQARSVVALAAMVFLHRLQEHL
jgi:hypothetical protein